MVNFVSLCDLPRPRLLLRFRMQYSSRATIIGCTLRRTRWCVSALCKIWNAEEKKHGVTHFIVRIRISFSFCASDYIGFFVIYISRLCTYALETIYGWLWVCRLQGSIRGFIVRQRMTHTFIGGVNLNRTASFSEEQRFLPEYWVDSGAVCELVR